MSFGSRSGAARAPLFLLSLLFGLWAIFTWLPLPLAGQADRSPPTPLVLLTDFGTQDGAVAAMKGVAAGVDPGLPIHDLTHQISPYHIWEAAYRLDQAAAYWPAGTVFVAVVDPGVGTDRRSVVLRTSSGHYFVTPDNGTLTLVAESLGIDEVREIDEAVHRRGDSERSYTFHGRDVYALTGARLAAGTISYEEVGRRLAPEVERIPHPRPVLDGNGVRGYVPILDVRYGNVWTNIDRATFSKLKPEPGRRFQVRILREGEAVFDDEVPFVRTFGDVPRGQPLLYFNSLDNLSLALNMESFAARYGVDAGPEWVVVVGRR